MLILEPVDGKGCSYSQTWSWRWVCLSWGTGAEQELFGTEEEEWVPAVWGLLGRRPCTSCALSSQPAARANQLHTFFFFFNFFFFFGCVRSLVLCEGFLQLRRVGATLHRGARASHYRGLSCCGAQAPDAQAQSLWLTGPVAPRHVGSSQTRARTRVPCIGRQILNHCATREALIPFLKSFFQRVEYLYMNFQFIDKVFPSIKQEFTCKNLNMCQCNVSKCLQQGQGFMWQYYIYVYINDYFLLFKAMCIL